MTYFTKRYHPPGTLPGTLDATKSAEVIPVTISLLDFDATHYTEQVNIAATECKPYLTQQSTTWVHIQGSADAKVLKELGEIFDLHVLALEDVATSGQRPKAEVYDDILFVVMNLPARTGEELVFNQVSLFLGENFVISICYGARDPFEPVRKRIRAKNGRIRDRKADYLLYALIDVVVDESFPVLEDFGSRIETLEDDLLGDPTRNTLQNIHDIKREVLLMRRKLWPHRDLLTALLHDEYGFFNDHTKLYLRDCYDHALQVIEFLQTYRDMSANMLDVYLSSVNLKFSDTIRVLTVITTIFIPLTFVTSIYGMNFDRGSHWNMPELGWHYGYLFVWGIMAAMVAAMLYYFRRKEWL